MKKTVLILILLVFIISGAFAQTFSISVGGGGLFDWSFNNGLETKLGSDTFYFGYRNMSVGAYIFGDFTYAELAAGFAYGIMKGVIDIPGFSDVSKAGSMLQVNANLLLKYPLQFGKVTFFPLLGASYNMVLVSKDDNGDKYSDKMSETIKNLSQIGILGGAGVDLFLTSSLFLRFETFYHLRLADKDTKDSVDAFETLFGGNAYATLGRGSLVKLGVGYKF